jgi:endonuclease-3
MSAEEIRDRLLDRGREIFDSPRQPVVSFTSDHRANSLISDIDGTPHAFVTSCIMDRQIRYERASMIPLLLSQRLGEFSFGVLERLSLGEIRELMTRPTPLHRFPETMSQNLHSAFQRIRRNYNGDASRIWRDRPSSYAVVYRFLEFNGVGVKIAPMAANVLARDFKVALADYGAIDVSPDRHVVRVFQRLGLVPSSASIEYLIYRARELSPEFPGLLDLPSFEIGRNWCRPHRPTCERCYMNDLCPLPMQPLLSTELNVPNH